MSYQGIPFQDDITIDAIYTIHYFEYMSDFSFDGESHSFWEFVCVDKGKVGITSGDQYHVLKKGEIIFHKPDEFHDVHATGDIAPNLLVISFDCQSVAMNSFKNRILSIDETERSLLATIIQEARNCFDCRLDDPFMEHMPLKADPPFGSGQLIRLCLEQFLIHLLRRSEQSELPVMPENYITMTKANNDEEIFFHVSEYLHQHVHSGVKLDRICRDNLIGRSQLQRIFKSRCGMGVIEYFFTLKIELAKELIRTGTMNFTQISEHLGYRSIQYFSRQFKKETGMTPSEYASSIKAISEDHR